MSAPKTILIAEDDPASRELLAEILRAAGYAVVEAADGLEAIAVFENLVPDLAILDIQMPKLDGFEVLRCVRQRLPAPLPPVMAVTAHALVGDRERALALGFDEYLTKPLEIAHLRRRITELLQ
ncbi:MAG: response regulator [Terriglobales bacterium]